MAKMHSQSHEDIRKIESGMVDRLTKAASTSMALSRRGFIKTALASAGALGMHLLGFKLPSVYADNCWICTGPCVSFCQRSDVYCRSPDNTYGIGFYCACRYSACNIWCWAPWKAWLEICDSGTYTMDCANCL